MKKLGLKDVLEVGSAEDARQLAIDWQQWTSETDISYDSLLKWQSIFEQLGAKYGLTEEFQENGIL